MLVRVDEARYDHLAFSIYLFVASSILPFDACGFSKVYYSLIFDDQCAFSDYLFFTGDYCGVVQQ